MTPFLHGFGDELVKVGRVAGLGALKSVGRFAVKHPLLTAGGAFTVVGTGLGARAGWRKGMSGEKKRYLAAGIDPRTGKAMTSRTARRNYSRLFDKPKAKGISKHYKEEAFKG